MSVAEAVLSTMAELGEGVSDEEVVARLVGAAYELALRLGVAPRSILDNAFTSVASDNLWHGILEPSLRAVLER